MTPERPRRADATGAQVETPKAVSRAAEPSALAEPGSAPLYAALDLIGVGEAELVRHFGSGGSRLDSEPGRPR